MARGGWAYTGFDTLGANGPTGSIQFRADVSAISGSARFCYATASNRVGIGITDFPSTLPNATLEVRGMTNITGSTYISGSAEITSNLTVAGNLTVNGTTTTISTTNTVVADRLIELASGASTGADSGIIIERGSTGNNAAILWDESRDEFVLATTTATGASTGDLSFTPANLSVERIGAGTEQAEAEIHAKRDSSSGGTYSSNAPIIIEDDARPALQFVGSANNIALIEFGDNAAAASGMLYYDHSTDKLRIDAGGNADRLTVDSSGNVTIAGELDAATLDISGNADIDGTLEADAITVDGTALAEVIADTAGAMFSSNTETGITATYQDGDNTIDLAINAAQTTITSLLATDIKIGEDDQTKIDFETADEIHFYAANAEQVYISDGVFGPQTDSDVDLGTTGVRWKDAYVDSVTSTGDILCSGEVQTANIGFTDGDNAITIADGGKVTFAAGFEVGSDAAGDILYHNGNNYVRLAKGDDDEVLTLSSGIPSWAAAAGTVSGDTFSTSLKVGRDAHNLIDFSVDDAVTFRVANVDEITLAANNFSPTTADGIALGSATKEWSDLYLADGGIVYFGDDQDVTLTHVADTGLTLKHTATADDKPIVLTLATGETDMAANDVIGKIAFQAPDEGAGTDAVLVSAAIQAVAEGDHSSSSNATRLEFMTGVSEAATAKMTLSSAGILDVDGGITVDNITIDANQIFSTGLKVGRDSHNIIDFSTDNEIVFQVNNSNEVKLVENILSPNANDGCALGSTALGWSDLFLADGATIKFGNDQDVTLTHIADTGLTLKHTATADDKPIILTLATGETDIAADDVLGTINFQAPDEGNGTDAILVAAGIEAVSEGDFSSSNNATKLSFKTASSAAAAETMSLSSAGLLTVADDIVIKSGGTIGGANDTDLLTLANGALTVAGTITGTTITASTAMVPDASDGATIGSASLEWSDLYLADGGIVYFGDDQDVTLSHVADTGLTLKHTATADDKPIVLTLATGETDMAANDVIGKIAFQAPDEGAGTDAILVSAAIQAVAEGDHSSSSNATRLEFMTGASEAATAKMTLSSAGILDVDGGITVDNITIDGTQIDLSSGDLTLDVEGDIILDANGGDVIMHDDGTEVGRLSNSSGDFVMEVAGNNKDIVFKGEDDSSVITALTLDMSAAGNATFNAGITAGTSILISDGGNIGSASDPDAILISNAGVVTFSQDIIVADDVTLGSDGAVLSFGDDQDITLTHVADTGLTLKHTATADDKPIVLTLATGETDIAADDVLGKIEFQAPDEGAGTDAILAAASIQAISEGDFSSSSNATSLAFFTANSAAAGTAADGGSMKLNSAGGLQLKSLSTADGSSPTITLQTGDTDIAANDVLGTINFQAPDEGTGTDAILVAAAISAVSEGDFSSSSNATKLSFKTGSSEAAAEKMSLSSGGVLTCDGGITVDNITIDGTEIDLSSGDLTVDVAGDITLDAGGGDVILSDDGTELGRFTNSSGDMVMKCAANNRDVLFKGVDDSSVITALTLDMSAAGTATFNHDIIIADGGYIGSASDPDAVLISNAGVVTLSATTAASATGTAALVVGGGIGVAGDMWLGDDLVLDSDAAVIKFGDDQEITLTHVADTGLTLKHTATADDKPVVLTLATGETDMAAGDILGKIAFQAPDEGTGTDAILVAAAIQAVSEGDFSSSNNATSLEFMTGASEAATTKMMIESDGDVAIKTDGATLSFGDNDEIQLTHVHNVGLILKHNNTADDSFPTLTLQTGDNNIANGDLLGQISFQAPDEGAGTDAILVAAGIAAVAEGDFSSSSNATSLSFRTGNSATASQKMVLDSVGRLGVNVDAPKTAFSVAQDFNAITFENQMSDGQGGGKILKYSPGADDTLTVGQLYFLHTDGTWDQTDADAVATGASQLLGVGLGSARTVGVLLEGYVRIPSSEILNVPGSGAVDGLPVYVSTTAGHFDFTAPSGGSDFVRVVGYAIDDDGGDVLVYFNPDRTWVEL
jgi:hypothetical protein